METSKNVQGTSLKKVSFKLKLFCYLGLNLGALTLSAAYLLEGAPVETTLSILIGLVVMNLVFWYLFRMRDRSAGGP